MRYFLSFFKPHRSLFIADLICAAFIAGVDLVFPMFTRYALTHFLASSEFRTFYIFIGVSLFLYLIRMGAVYFVAYFGHLFGARVEADMRRAIFNHIEKQSFAFFDRNRTGQLMSRITTDLFEVTELAHHGPEDILISALTLSGSLILMSVIKAELALLLAAFIPLIVLHTALSRSRLMHTSKNVKEKTAEINTAIESAVSGIRVTKIFTNEAYEKQRFEKNTQAYYNARKGFYRSVASFLCRIDFFTSILNLIILGAGGFFIMRGSMNIADLITALLFSSAFLQPVRRITAFVEQYASGMAGFRRFAEIMNTHEEIHSNPNAVNINGARGDIDYEHIDFAYNNGITVLHNVNLSIKAGQTVAFVGPSGSGKTTLCSLLPRFYDVQSGSIKLDGRDIRDIKVESLRRHIGLVQQDVFLFAGTVKENIAYGNIEASDEEIIEAARQAEIHDDIIKMDKGYDTLVGERGVRLSGGQKQRISIARTFLKNPPILILDEATSALDTATEIKIQQSFEKLAKGRTTLVIAHRLSTIRNADLIVVVDDEGICEQGKHSELLAQNGLYASLYKAQNKL
ncbi:ABC transporter ATP-binding protein [Treponema sp. OMZ 840]|uniref:ABC transporter ATP-binding protein n=1 Tax=Treponema sp. OMZ 840 TaxID=244313 RepID=UPI003D921799